MLKSKLDRLIKVGRLSIAWPNGEVWRFGDQGSAGPDVAVRLESSFAAAKIAVHPHLYLGEAYMDGELTMERGGVFDLLDLLGRNLALREAPPNLLQRWARRPLALLQQYNSQRSARRNVARHYDFSERLYRAFLDVDLQYSCAYFARPDMTLEEAQTAKRRHIAGKLLLKSGQRVLDIGCGFGGLALHIARSADVEVLGVTLSREQLDVAKRRAREAGLDGRVRFELADYRALDGRFDRIVSVGMFEHVGKPQYPKFFAVIARLLDPKGVALLHAIGRMRGPGLTSAWIRRYIFPGGYIPALSDVAPIIERSGLWLTDLEVLRLHYAETLRHWRQRFLANRSSLADLYDDRFCRMWEFYLAASETSFRHGGFMVLQAQLSHAPDAAPLTRDYMTDADRS
ncbi:MAG TPA: cyclopropane-fatty-acyl-phospholipid synthase family protein [Roseiarcus sp.]|nr:cyclopropane-fatty-acyl-phospholipid synthase family protein [Roseiarcus sp.]